MAGLTAVILVGGLLGGCALDPMERLTEDMNAQDVSVRHAAVVELANLNDPRATDALIQALDSDDTKVYGQPDAAKPAPGGKAKAEATTEAKAETPAAPVGLRASTSNPDLTIGDLAGVALVKKGRERKTKQKPDPLLDAIAKVMGNLHTSEANRARAAWALGEIGDRMAIPPLKAAQGGAKTAAGADALLVRQAAQEALEKLGYDTKGRDYEMPRGALDEPLRRLPEPKKIVLPPAKPA